MIYIIYQQGSLQSTSLAPWTESIASNILARQAIIQLQSHILRPTEVTFFQCNCSFEAFKSNFPSATIITCNSFRRCF
ncbi:hypothetical protein I79_003957 [Cricetulus griseus]|uniref:Uncharacterized protein n=1 Tax=Cricetulus griseus TaxID=10029 RepID=G3H1D3_CRIGR|nr:hypothetical protein I79_003957 [Cricetulus griseus]